MKKKLNFNLPVLGLNRQPIKDGDTPMIIAKGLALNLAQTTKGDAVKFYSWGVELESTGTLELDPSDVELLKNTVTDFGIASLLKAQILMIILA